MKRAIIILALVATVALPFLLRPKQPALARADDTVVIVTAHNEAVRFEFGRGFQDWYRARTGRSVSVDWRVLGGGTEIARYLESAYSAAFERYWTQKAGRTWTADIQNGFINSRLPADAPEAVRAARAEFLSSEVGCGVDLFFGGGTPDFDRQAQAGRLVPTRILKTHPGWFTDAVIPRTFTGEKYWDPEGKWIGSVLGNYGILCNSDALARLGLPRPVQWIDLTDPRYVGQVALADPTKSSSIAKAFENILQQQMRQKVAGLAEPPGSPERVAAESRAVAEGWLAGLRLIQGMAANARYFTDSSQKPLIDVAQGDCAAGVCIDFYGRTEAEAVSNRGSDRLAFVSPRGGTVNSVDPIGLLRGAPHREVAELFIEFTLSMEGQKLLALKPGAPDGPERFALRRLPVRRDFYSHAEWKPLRRDPDADPFSDPDPLIYQPAWTNSLFRELGFITRVMCLDTHRELTAAWRAIAAAPESRRARALAELQAIEAVDYAQANGRIRAVLASKNKADELNLARQLGDEFRGRYARAEALARGGK